ncbi:MAG: hypothetical protein L6R40_007850 [Gallowayella cf. fulva]|nr:MAG: hypothetical protein L6R40_007850 [Xanthomendoza cf. fulva]
MPDKPLTVLTYAASASLAAVALVYLFSPNQLIDGDSSTTSASGRKKGIVGLVNPANDCFINSVLQSLAALGDLRLFLIREVHRRSLDHDAVYTSVSPKDHQGKDVDTAKLAGLQKGEVTQGLKTILDQLNERPIYKKTISAQAFIAVLEHAFATRISRTQQDAQELLQIVAERLDDEYEAGKRARRRAKRRSLGDDKNDVGPASQANGEAPKTQTLDPSSVASKLLESSSAAEETSEAEEGFPLQGQTEARVECQHCHFVPKPAPTSFVMLNLMVPQKSTTTLNECFDAHFKTENIDDYKCDRCRLDHAVETLEEELLFAKTVEQKDIIQTKIDRVREARDTDPEKPPERIQLPDIKHAPKRKVARHVQITKFPKVLIIHLSRSMFDPGSYSQKNSAKLSFPERLPIGGILNRKNYKLLGLLTHKGTHNSGHYETFRRQHLYPPTSKPHVRSTTGPYSAPATPNASNQASPQLSGNLVSPPRDSTDEREKSLVGDRPSISTTQSPAASTVTLSTPSSRPGSRAAAADRNPRSSRNIAVSAVEPTTVLSQSSEARPSPPNASRYSASMDLTRFRRKKKSSDRWWRISDDKIKECSTVDVLAMQKDVYMLFYEMERKEPAML